MPRNKEAQRVYWRKYYAKRYKADPAFRAERRRTAERQKQQIRELIQKLKEAGACKCGEDHPAALDFHHRDGSNKIISVANAARAGFGVKRLLAEVAKCKLMCANCHRKLEAKHRRRRKTA